MMERQFVQYMHPVPMFGWMILAAAAVAVVMALLLRSRSSHRSGSGVLGRVVFALAVMMLLAGFLVFPVFTLRSTSTPLAQRTNRGAQTIEVLAETDDVHTLEFHAAEDHHAADHQAAVRKVQIGHPTRRMTDFSACLSLMGGVVVLGLISKTIAQRFDGEAPAALP